MCGTASPTNAIGPGGGDRAAGEQHEADARRRARAADVLAERAGDVVAERQRVEPAPGAERDREPGGDERQHGERDARRRGRRSSRRSRSGTRRASARRRRARALVSETSSVASTAPASASLIGVGPPRPEPPRTNTSTALRPAPSSANTAKRRDGGHAEQSDREHDGERRPGVDPEDPRLGQRVARHALHERAGRAERRADEQPELRARHAQVAHDRVGVAAVVGGERADHLGERQRARADRPATRSRRAPAARRTPAGPRAGRVGSAGARVARSAQAVGGSLWRTMG